VNSSQKWTRHSEVVTGWSRHTVDSSQKWKNATMNSSPVTSSPWHVTSSLAPRVAGWFLGVENRSPAFLTRVSGGPLLPSVV